MTDNQSKNSTSGRLPQEKGKVSKKRKPKTSRAGLQSSGSKESISIPLLTSLLSTIDAENMVILGMVAVVYDNLQRAGESRLLQTKRMRGVKRRYDLQSVPLQMCMESTRAIESAISTLRSTLDAAVRKRSNL